MITYLRKRRDCTGSMDSKGKMETGRSGSGKQRRKDDAGAEGRAVGAGENLKGKFYRVL